MLCASWLKIKVLTIPSTGLSFVTPAFAPTAPCAWNLCSSHVFLQFPASTSPLPRAFPDPLGPRQNQSELLALSAWTVVPLRAGPCHPMSLLICLLAQEFPRAGSDLCGGGRPGTEEGLGRCSLHLSGNENGSRRRRSVQSFPSPLLPAPRVQTAAGPAGQSPWVRETTVLCSLQKCDCNILLALSSELWEEAARGNGGGGGLWMEAWAPLGQNEH